MVSYKIASEINLEIFLKIWKFISKCEIYLQFIQISKFCRRNFQVKDPWLKQSCTYVNLLINEIAAPVSNSIDISRPSVFGTMLIGG